MSRHDNLSFFEPSNVPPYHENQLTRGFLVVLRVSPAAHQVWLAHAAPGRKLYELPRPWSFDTQRWQMIGSEHDAAEPIEGISVLQAADVQAVDGAIRITDRGQVLDGIVRYGDELLIVIETKLDGPVAKRQAQELNVHGAHVRFDGGVQTVSWRDLLAGWSDLVESEVVAGSERTIIIDFLDFVERRFPRLGPFTTLSRCKDNNFRVARRLNAVLNEIADGLTNSWLDLPNRATVDRAYLKLDDSSQHVRLAVYPADTLTQARAFYRRPAAPSRVMSLRNEGWSVEPNFHFGFRALGLAWTTSNATLDEYVDHWRERIDGTGAIHRENWEEFWGNLIQLKFARVEDKRQFDQAFTNSGRQSAVPRPGIVCRYSWTLSEARLLDDRGQLVSEVAEKLNVLLQALGERLHERPV